MPTITTANQYYYYQKIASIFDCKLYFAAPE